MSISCRICFNSEGNQVYHCREMMFGWGDKFDYFQCSRCGCLQIADFPEDLGRFYPADYYSFHTENARFDGLRSWLGSKRDLYAATRQGILGRLLEKSTPSRADIKSLGRIPLRRDDKILDVGCGKGQLLSYLYRAGFKKLSGIDPYLPTDIQVSHGVSVRKASLDQCEEQFDVIMLHHVFEHLAAPLETLQQCVRRLARNGKILLRFPTADSEAWRHYRVNWVQLDAPRHLFLHTSASIKLLAEKAGLRVMEWQCDSTEFQFWASELYGRNIPLTTATAKGLEKYFSKNQMKQFAAKANELNASGAGDQVVVILSPNSSLK